MECSQEDRRQLDLSGQERWEHFVLKDFEHLLKGLGPAEVLKNMDKDVVEQLRKAL